MEILIYLLLIGVIFCISIMLSVNLDYYFKMKKKKTVKVTKLRHIFLWKEKKLKSNEVLIIAKTSFIFQIINYFYCFVFIIAGIVDVIIDINIPNDYVFFPFIFSAIIYGAVILISTAIFSVFIFVNSEKRQ